MLSQLFTLNKFVILTRKSNKILKNAIKWVVVVIYYFSSKEETWKNK